MNNGKLKKIFEESRMEIYQFSFKDVITTSGASDGGVDGFDVEDSGLDFSSGVDGNLLFLRTCNL